MATEMVEIPISDLLLDSDNARLGESQPTEQATALALAKQQGSKLVNLASDIVEAGLDPTALMAIVPTTDRKKRYIVLEGNRRLLALRSLDTPSLVSGALDDTSQKRLNVLGEKYAQDPVEKIQCVLFDNEYGARRWIRMRHTGENEGRGLVEWGSDEKDRFDARHGERSLARQVLDFVEEHGSLSDEATSSSTKIITSLKRLLSTPEVREKLGMYSVEGRAYSLYPSEQIAKSLSHVIEDLFTKRINVGDIYTAEDRKAYVSRIPKSALPKKATRLESPVALDDLRTGSSEQRHPPKTRTRRKKRQTDRTSLIPKDCHLDIAQPRINAIYNELLSLSVEQYPNAASVTLRVMVELSVDHYLETEDLMSDADRSSKPLAKRLKTVSSHLERNGAIGKQLKTAIDRIADSKFVLAATTITFNQYSHNKYVYPKASELRTAWDELQPFMEALWP